MGAVASIAVSCAWPPFFIATVFALLALFLPRSMMLAILAWNLACLAMSFLHGYVIAPAITFAYEAHFGDIQASYGRYEWVSTIAAFVIIPLLPAFMSVRLYDQLVRRPSDWRRIVASSIVWELLLVPILIWSYWFSLHYKINQIAWAVNGPPENIYSFTNLALPRLIAWLICTVPVGLAVLWLHQKTGGHHVRKLDRTLAEPPPRQAA